MARGSVTVKIAGLSELGKNLATFSKEIKGKILRKAARAAANEVRDQAKKNFSSKFKQGDEPDHVLDAIAARRIGRASSEGKEFWAVGVFKIRKSAKTGKAFTYANNRANRRAQRAGKSYEVDPPEFYWKFLEFGTVKMRGRPYLVPAFEQRKAGLPGVMAEELDKGMQAATRKLSKVKTKANA